MAYMSQERKAEIAVELKKVMPHNWKYSLGVHHHSTLQLTISAAPVDLVNEYLEFVRRNARPDSGWFEHKNDYVQVNEHHLDTQFEGKRLAQMQAIKSAMMKGNHDNSEPMTDYFDVGWYISIDFGRYNKPFQFTGSKPTTVADINAKILALQDEQAKLLKQLA